MFRPLKGGEGGYNFDVVQKRKSVYTWFNVQTKPFFCGFFIFLFEGIKMLVEQWAKYIEKERDYIEKVMLLHIVTYTHTHPAG